MKGKVKKAEAFCACCGEDRRDRGLPPRLLSDFPIAGSDKPLRLCRVCDAPTIAAIEAH